MGKYLFRLFVVQSMVDPKNDIIGIFEPLSYSYFEVTEKLSSNIRLVLDQSFSNDFVTNFIFYNKDGKPYSDLDPETTLFIQLNLKGGEKKLALTKRDFKKFHVFVENNIQWRKQEHFDGVNKANQEMERKLEEMNKKHEIEMKSIFEKMESVRGELDNEKAANKENLRKQEELFRRLNEEQEGRMIEKTDGITVNRERINKMEKLVSIMEKERIEKEKMIEKERIERIELEKKKNDWKNRTTIMELHHFEGLKKLCDFNFEDFKLLYRGSRDGFSSANFHGKCDNVRGTLVVIKSDIDNVFGGFNPVRWNEATSNAYFRTNDSWIFGFGNKKIMKFLPTKNPQFAIKCLPGYGPLFGGGHDIFVYGNCNSNSNNQLNCNHTYDLKGKNNHFLNGGVKNFKVKDIEVYSRK